MRQYLGHCEGVPEPTSPISHAVATGGLCWISGQHALDEYGRYRRGTVREEATRCFELLLKVARAAGFDAKEIVFVDVALTKLSDIAEFNEVYVEVFGPEERPARAIIAATELAFGARVKVAAVAAHDRGQASGEQQVECTAPPVATESAFQRADSADEARNLRDGKGTRRIHRRPKQVALVRRASEEESGYPHRQPLARFEGP
ncbi:MAG TPA: RidA family protein [Sphingomicrobium sp.]|nr:RidA family protein [Sphingomicrobium sp.]